MKSIENEEIIFLLLVFFFPLTRSKLRMPKKITVIQLKKLMHETLSLFNMIFENKKLQINNEIKKYNQASTS